MQAKRAGECGHERVGSVRCELEPRSGAGHRVELDHGVVETAGGVDDGHRAVTQAVELVEAAGLEA